MNFKMKYEESGMKIYGESMASVKRGISFFESCLKEPFLTSEPEYTGKVGTDEAYMAKVLRIEV